MANPSENGKRAAARLARRIGCSGAHQNADGVWMPCGSHEELQKISTEAETAVPKNLGKSEPPCLGCKDAKPDRSRQGASYRKRWSKLRERGVTGINTMEGGGLTSAPVTVKKFGEWGNRVIFGRSESKELNERQEALYEATEELVEDHGKFDQGAGPDGAHYMPAAKNPFVKDGLVCSNCAYWVGPNGCEIVAGKLEPNAICKLWIIDGSRLKSEKSDVDVSGKGLGPSIGGRGRGLRVEPFDPDAEDGDEDGEVQDGTIHQRPKPPTPKRGLEMGKNTQKKKPPSSKTPQKPVKNSGKKVNPFGSYKESPKVGFYKINNKFVRSRFSKAQADAMQRRNKNLRSALAKKYGVDENTSINDAAAVLRSVFPNLDTLQWNNHIPSDSRLGSYHFGTVIGLLAAYEVNKNNKTLVNMNIVMKTFASQPGGRVITGSATDYLMNAATELAAGNLGFRVKPGIVLEFARETDMLRIRGRNLQTARDYEGKPMSNAIEELLHNSVSDRYGYSALGSSSNKIDEWLEMDAFHTALHEMGHTSHYVANLKKVSRRGEKLGLDPINENTDITKWALDYLKATGKYEGTLETYLGDKFDAVVAKLQGQPPAIRQEAATALGLPIPFDWNAPESKEVFINAIANRSPAVVLDSIFDDVTFETFRGFSEMMTTDELDTVEKALLKLSMYAQQTPFKNGAIVEGPAELLAYLGLGGVFDNEKEAAAIEKLLEYLGIDMSEINDLMDAGERQGIELDNEPNN